MQRIQSFYIIVVLLENSRTIYVDNIVSSLKFNLCSLAICITAIKRMKFFEHQTKTKKRHKINFLKWRFLDFLRIFVCAYLIVVALRLSPTCIKLYACHMSSLSSGTKSTWLKREVFYFETILFNHIIWLKLYYSDNDKVTPRIPEALKDMKHFSSAQVNNPSIRVEVKYSSTLNNYISAPLLKCYRPTKKHCQN